MKEKIKELIECFVIFQNLSRDKNFKIIDENGVLEIIIEPYNGHYLKIFYGDGEVIYLYLGISYDGKMTPPQNKKYGYVPIENRFYPHMYRLKGNKQLEEIIEKYIAKQ